MAGTSSRVRFGSSCAVTRADRCCSRSGCRGREPSRPSMGRYGTATRSVEPSRRSRALLLLRRDAIDEDGQLREFAGERGLLPLPVGGESRGVFAHGEDDAVDIVFRQAHRPCHPDVLVDELVAQDRFDELCGRFLLLHGPGTGRALSSHLDPYKDIVAALHETLLSRWWSERAVVMTAPIASSTWCRRSSSSRSITMTFASVNIAPQRNHHSARGTSCCTAAVFALAS